jgi:hypothetical protein
MLQEWIIIYTWGIVTVKLIDWDSCKPLKHRELSDLILSPARLHPFSQIN